jgi:hypothetical protein
MSRHSPFPFVRTQIPPEARDAARKVGAALDWNLPGVYAAAVCYALLEVGADRLIEFLTAALPKENGAESEDQS